MPQSCSDVEDGVNALTSETCLVYPGSTANCAAPLQEVAGDYHLKANKEVAWRWINLHVACF